MDFETPNTPVPYEEPAAETVIETASATTSRDNANSGNAAYVIFGVALALIVLVTMAVSTCSSIALRSYSSGNLWHERTEDFYYDDYLEDLLKVLDEAETTSPSFNS